MHRSMKEAKKAMTKRKASAGESIQPPGGPESDPKGDQDATRDSDICFGWRDSGECTFGSTCKFAHPEKERASHARASSARMGRKSKMLGAGRDDSQTPTATTN